jgi:hypothetical protein
MFRFLSIALMAWLPISILHAEDPIFSGPQAGETLPPLQVLGLTGDWEGKSFDLVKEVDGGPVLVVFFHERTRPGFRLMQDITKFASERTVQGMTVAVVFLTDDVTETTKWSANVRQHFFDEVIYTVSPDGQEGPGAYGLNRNVTLTILVGDDGKVTKNFALVQPQSQADGPAILKAVAAVSGGGEIPTMDELEAGYARGGQRMQRPMRQRNASGQRGPSDPKLASMLREVISKQASDEQVRGAAAKVEAYITQNDGARRELARIVTTVVDSGKIENYGTRTAQEILRQWKAKLAEPARGASEGGAKDSTSPRKGDANNDQDET